MSKSQELTIDEALSRAKKATKQGNLADAIELYSVILQHQPQHPLAKKRLRKLQKSLPRNQTVPAQMLNPPQAQVDALVNLYGSGNLIKAEQVCNELLHIYPQSLIVLDVLAAALRRQGKLQEAVKAFDRSIQLKPDYAEAYSNRGVALKKLGQLEEAVKSY
ncbi:MAG: tetratricopeptide repeat protein, partial [Gammaproteobacteria bacterium]|nr:tetratricopeptide repeat protein [Gammaproteobacteria bacterium]